MMPLQMVIARLISLRLPRKICRMTKEFTGCMRVHLRTVEAMLLGHDCGDVWSCKLQENEEEDEKQAAPKAPNDRDVFAGNKNLRSEDNKFRERDQDR